VNFEEFVREVRKRLEKEDPNLLEDIDEILAKNIESADVGFLKWFDDMLQYYYHYTIWFGFSKAYKKLVQQLSVKIANEKLKMSL
jgi:hypothetical protein